MIWDTVSCYYGLFTENCFINKRCCVIVLHNFCYHAVVYFSFNSAQFILFFFTIGEKCFYTFIVLPLL